MVEFRSTTQKNAAVLAHEMGHILGANHDDTFDNIGRDCKPDGYVMTASIAPRSIHHFKFSDCSYMYFYTMFTKLSWECLDNGKPEDVVKGKRLGTTMTADQACQREIDKYAFVDRWTYWVYGDNVCTTLKCNRGDGEMIDIYSPQGLYCGKNKQCLEGKCVETDEGKNDVSDDCPFGDQPKINYEGHSTCNDLPLEYCGVMKAACCKRCNIEEMGAPDRMCRKLMKNPKSQMNRQAYAGRNFGDTICKWLACNTGKEADGKWAFKWKRHDSEGMVCGANKRCTSSRCLPANDGLSYLDDSCPFGDQPYSVSGRRSCYKSMTSYDDIHRSCLAINWGDECCAFCKGK